MYLSAVLLALSTSIAAAQNIPAPNFGFHVHHVAPKAIAAPFNMARPGVTGAKVLPLKRQKSSSLARHYWSHVTANQTRPTKNKGYGLSILSPAEGGLQFITDITFGNQTVQAAIDTGSADTWVAAVNFQCVDMYTYEFAPQSACMFGEELYQRSPTFRRIPDQNFNISYGGGDFVLGLVGNDTVTIGGLSVVNQTFGVVGVAATLWDGVSEGLIGLAYPSLTSAYAGSDRSLDSESTNIPYNDLFTNMYTQGLVRPVFSLAIDRDTGGYLAFGGLPPVTWRPPVVTVPIEIVALSDREAAAVNHSFYIVTPRGFTYGTSSSPSTTSSSLWSWLSAILSLSPSGPAIPTDFPVIIDSGTTLTYLPRRLADNINAAFKPPSFYDFTVGGYLVDCNATAPTFSVNIAGSNFNVRPQDLIVAGTDEGYCASGIQDAGYGPSILGDSFLKNVLVVFDVGASQMRFAAR